MHQDFVAFWQLYPLWILVLKFLIDKITGATSYGDVRSRDSSPLHGWQLLAAVYTFGIYLSSVTHIATFTLALAARYLPSLFAGSLAQQFSLSAVFVPPNFLYPSQVESIAQGMHVFLQYDDYVGSSAMLIWASFLTLDMAQSPSSPILVIEMFVKVIAKVLLYGPGATVLILMMEKDRLLSMNEAISAHAQKFS